VSNTAENAARAPKPAKGKEEEEKKIHVSTSQN